MAIGNYSCRGFLFFFWCTFLLTFSALSDVKRPSRGTIQFGAKDPPARFSVADPATFQTIFAEIAKNVVPAVVSVIPTKIDTVFSGNPFYQNFNEQPDNPFDEFFRGPQEPPSEPKEYRQEGLGSGVIVSSQGYVLTNYHVVSGADEIEIKTSDGKNFESDIIGVDSLADIAVIKIRNPPTDLKVAYFGDSDKIRPGDWAIAVGNPFSLTSSVTMGIISALGRTTPGTSSTTYQNYIQTDAAINPGNSGGALVNAKGELIAINTLIYTQSGGYMGIGFAIPINMARQIMEDLIYDGMVKRGWLGITIQELDPVICEAFSLPPDTKGVLVGDVLDGEPAQIVGIRIGDIILSINGKRTETTNQLKNVVGATRPGERINLDYLRKGKHYSVQITLRQRGGEGQIMPAVKLPSETPSKQGHATVSEKLGILIGNLTKPLREKISISKELSGVVIIEVNPASVAYDANIIPLDVILEVNQKKVGSIKDFDRVTRGLKKGDTVLFFIQREGSTFFKAFKLKS